MLETLKFNTVKTKDDLSKSLPLLNILLEEEEIQLPDLNEAFENLKKAQACGYRLYAASDDKRIIAIVGLTTVYDPSGQSYLRINNLVVDEQYRGRGLGTSLLNRAEEIAKEEDMNAVVLEVLNSNDKAIKLYESLGYKVICNRMLKSLEE